MPGKNKKGGSGHRKMARKNLKPSFKKSATRLANVEEGEIYAKVTKCYGNGMVDVFCNDEVTRLCIIRKKFKGRNKKYNIVNIDSIVLVGLRTWEVVGEKKKPKVDLLCTYNSSELEDVKKDPNFSILIEEVKENENSTIEFSNNVTLILE